MSIFWMDGEFIEEDILSISHRDSGFTNGLGVFDSVFAENEDVVDYDDHMERLRHDVQVVLRKKLDTNILGGVMHKLLRRNGLGRSYARVKTIVTGGITEKPLVLSGDLSIIVSVSETVAPDSFPPLRCTLIEKYPRIKGCALENCKRLDYSRAYAARQDAIQKGADDAIILNTDGNIACATTSNVFIREGDDFFTPPLSDGVLAGITRQKIIEGRNYQFTPMQGDGYVSEESISIGRFRKADEVFVTNSFFGIRPVTMV